MKYTLEFPVIHVAYIQSTSDLQWAFDSLTEGSLFSTVNRDNIYGGNVINNRFTAEDLVLLNDIALVTHSASGWNPAQVALTMHDFLTWNQEGAAYAINNPSSADGRFSVTLPEHLIPEALQKLVLVKI